MPMVVGANKSNCTKDEAQEEDVRRRRDVGMIQKSGGTRPRYTMNVSTLALAFMFTCLTASVRSMHVSVHCAMAKRER